MSDFYSFIKEEHSDGSIYYTFITRQGYSYYAYFHFVADYSPYASALPFVSRYGYLFCFSPSYETEELKKRVPDNRIEPTIRKIVTDFWSEYGKDKALFFYTDNSDREQRSRSKLFEIWYKNGESNDGIYFESLEIEIDLHSGKRHEYLGILLSQNHPSFEEIKSEFKSLEILLITEK